ncbi:hypothetical protein [Streptomyces sp. NPDC050534]|uniref:hypothetical protein n=1 Tax=Streptomyces sp. NPDC050534 TaxID=3365625 RepID=UPI0037BBD663
MRWWVAGWAVAGLVVLAACGGSSGGTPSAASSPGRSAEPSSGAPTHGSTTPVPAPSSVSPTGPGTPSGSAPAGEPSSAAGGCAAGHTQVTVSPGDAPTRRLCVRPGTVISIVLEPRADDRRWTAVHSSAPVFVVASGWRLGPDGSAHASLRCAGTRGGGARITALAKAPDVAGAARAAFTLDVSVVPYPKEG